MLFKVGPKGKIRFSILPPSLLFFFSCLLFPFEGQPRALKFYSGQLHPSAYGYSCETHSDLQTVFEKSLLFSIQLHISRYQNQKFLSLLLFSGWSIIVVSISSLIASEPFCWLFEMLNYFALFVLLDTLTRSSANTSGKYNEFCSVLVMEQKKDFIPNDLVSRECLSAFLHF